jgi:CubicO group peptidase (beta-lactamase class C family)
MPLDHLATGAMVSATGFSSTAVDLVAFYQAHLLGNDRLLEDSDKRAMQRTQFKDGDYEWGLGFRRLTVGDAQFACHGGRFPGFITFSGLNQDRKLVIAVLTNAVDGPARELFVGISNLVCLALDHPDRFDGEVIGELDAVSGFYRSLWGIDCFGRIGGNLAGFNPSLDDPAGELDVLERVGPRAYRVPIRNQVSPIGEMVRFIPDEDGRITKVLFPGGSSVRWEIPTHLSN